MTALRILIMTHIPLRRELGGTRVQLELAEIWAQQGHQIEFFDRDRALPHTSLTLWSTLTQPQFSRLAREFVRKQGDKFDLIDAHQGNLPFTKADLRFSGLLVARSVGLHAWYAQFNRSRQMHQGQSWKGRIVQGLLAWRDREESQRCWRSYQTADLLNLPNPEEKAYLDHYLGTAGKSYVFPFGLTPERQQNLEKHGISPANRLRSPTVVFIGTWSPRKGAQDWRTIILTVRDRVPAARFLFLGTGLAAAKIHAELQLPTPGIEIVPYYNSEALPRLLATATVGAFPSYVEGFGFAVLEKLAAGIPTIAYAAAGPKSILARQHADCVVPIGDRAALSRKIIDILHLKPSLYAQLAQSCQTTAKRFNWHAIARDTLTTYQAHLAQLP